MVSTKNPFLPLKLEEQESAPKCEKSQSSKGKSRCNLNSKTSRAANHTPQSPGNPGSPGPCFWMPFSKPTKGENIRWAGDKKNSDLVSYLSHVDIRLVIFILLIWGIA